MKKGLPFLVTGIIIITVAIFGFTNAERVIRAGSFLVESTTKTVGLATPKDNQPSVIEQWAGGMAGCVQNLEVEVDYAGLYIKMGTAVAERLTKNMVEEKLEDFGIKVDKSDDGSWNINIGGTSIELSDSNWPDNEFTKQVPKPEFEPTVASTSENSFSVAFLGVGVAELRQYVEVSYAMDMCGMTITKE